jgi:hypothetical protein
MSNILDEITGHKMAGLTIDIMSKLRDGTIAVDELENFLKMVTEERRKIFGDKKMKFMASIAVKGLAEKFEPQKHFTENKKVKYWLGDNFQKHVLKPAKTISSLPAMEFSKHQFTETIYDKEIMESFSISESSGLMTREEILWTIAELTSKQSKGEAGTLINNGYATIIGYMLCDDGVVRVVRVRWNADDASWNCTCGGLDDWNAGDEMLSRNKTL